MSKYQKNNHAARIVSMLLALLLLASVAVFPEKEKLADGDDPEEILSQECEECLQEEPLPEEALNNEELPITEEFPEAVEIQAEQDLVPDIILKTEKPVLDKELIQENLLVQEEIVLEELSSFIYPWQGKTEAEFASWVKSWDNEGYLKTILLDKSGVYAEEVALLKERIAIMEIEILKDDISAYIAMLESGTEESAETGETAVSEESVMVATVIPAIENVEQDFVNDTADEEISLIEPEIIPDSENDELIFDEIIPDEETELVDKSQNEEDSDSDTNVPEVDEEISGPSVDNESDSEPEIEKIETEEPVAENKQYEWSFADDAEFKAWVLDKQNRKYIRNLTTATDDAELNAEKEAFNLRIESVAAEEDRLEIVSAVTELSVKLLAAGAPKKTYIKGKNNAIKYIEDCLIARKTSFDLFYESDTIVKNDTEARKMALELLREANGSYIDTYNGNGNGSDYIAFQSTSGAMGCGIDEQTGSTTKMTFCYYATYYDTADEEAQVQQAAANLLSSLGIAGMSSNYEKARAIYMWIVSNVKYGFCSDNPENHPYTAYGALIEKKAVCQGISALTYKLMNDAGVPCRTMASASHNWNVVQIDGAWYIIDATNGTLGADYYFLIGTDTYSRYQQPMPGYVDMWNSLSKKSYEQATAATTGTICTNLKWTIKDNVLTFEPVDPTKYSSLATTREEQNKWNADVVDKFYNYIDTIIFNNISDYGGYAPFQNDAVIAYGGFSKLKSCIHKGSFPTNPLIYLGLPAAYTVEVPCSWTDANILSMGFSWYLDGPSLENHTTLNPNGPKIIKAHDFSIAQEAATCTEPGGSILICSYCGEKKETGSSLPALDHNYVEMERKDATCKEAGYVKSKCSRCNDEKTETLKKLDHIKDKGTVITPATCTKEGEISYTCTLCHANLGKEKLKMKEHEYKETSRTDATCETNGKVIYTCDVCKGTKDEILKAPGHDPEPMASTETTTGGIQCKRCKKILEEPTQGIAVSLDGVGKGETVYINGIPFTASANNQVIIPANMRNVTSASTYTYGSGSGGSYPTGMKVWILSQNNKTGLVTSERASYLDNLMTYSGTSIRLKGNQGIAIHTDINSGTWNSLVGGGYHGYKVQEAGLLVTKTFENDTPTYGGSGVIKGMAYDRNGSIRSVNPDGARCYYMNTLVFGDDMEKTKWNLACRPYMIVTDSNGNSITLYGGILVRSVRSVAQQIQPMYKNDKAVSDFINKILSA